MNAHLQVSPVKSADELLDVMVQCLNNDLKEVGYELEVELVAWKDKHATFRQLRNRFTAQNVSPVCTSIVEIGGIVNTLRSFVRIPRADE